MNIQAIAKGMAAGAAAGTVGYLISTAAESKKTKLKRRTMKAVHALGAVMDTAADFFR